MSPSKKPTNDQRGESGFDADRPRLDAADRAWLEPLRDELDPGERSPAERTAFQARLDERLEQSAPVWRPAALALTTAMAALLLWVGLPTTAPQGEELAVEVEPQSAGLLAYAYYETDYLDGAGSQQAGFLSDEYLAIESVFGLE